MPERSSSKKSYLWESRAEMGHAEKTSTRQAINQSAMVGEATLERRDNLAPSRIV
ncbi:MAG: hypothetical protein ACLFRW_00340 [Halorhodospira sp.]